MRKAAAFDPRQEMNRADFEVLHMRDTYLKDVELHHHDFFEVFFLAGFVLGFITFLPTLFTNPGEVVVAIHADISGLMALVRLHQKRK